MIEVLSFFLFVIILLSVSVFSMRRTKKTAETLIAERMGYNPRPLDLTRPAPTPPPPPPPPPPPRRPGPEFYTSSYIVRSTDELFNAINKIDAKLLKTLILVQIRTRLTKEQYDFFTAVLNEHLSYLQIKKAQDIDELRQEKNTKLQWIEKQEEK